MIIGAMELGAGDQFDRYVVESILGRGGMGVVYLARDERLGRRVALKILAPELATDASFRARFQEEARLAASIDEPHIVPIYEAGENAGRLFLAMRYVAGFDLETLLRRHGPLEPARAISVIEQVASALDAAHGAGLVHRDVKPANVLIATSGQGADHVYLGDFGLARSAAKRQFTKTGQFVGSLEYGAPEQIEGVTIDERADIYALGGVLYASLSGRPPYETTSDAALLYAHLHADPPKLSSVRFDLPPAIDAVIARSLAKKPAARYATAGELATSARRALVGGGTETMPTVGRPSESPVGSSWQPELPAHPEARKTVTVLFTDLVGSTALGEQLDPEALRGLLSRYFDDVRQVIERHGGVAEKFIGDAAMGVFGVPTLHEDDAVRAVRAASDIGDRLVQLNAGPAAHLGVTLAIRTGINTGEVVAGNPAQGQMAVTGDPVNTAARLQQAAAPGEILLGDSTFRLVRDRVTAELRAGISAKGKAKPIVAYVLRGVRGQTAASPRFEAPMIGRDQELALLLARWQRTTSDRVPRLVTVLGTAGIGKTRLIHRFTEEIDGRAFYGRCLPYGEGITYWPIREVVHAAAGITDADATSLAQSRLIELLGIDPQAPLLAERVAAAVGLQATEVPQQEIFWAVRRLLEQLARNEPTLIVLEDLGWAEETLLDLIDYTLDLATDAPLMLVASARPDILERRPGWSSGRPNSDLLRLEPLASNAALELVRSQPGGDALPGSLSERICATAEGNPLFVEEMVATLRDAGDLRVGNDGHWTFAGTPGQVVIPPTIRALLAARIDRLAPDERVVAERASVVGRSFEASAVSELLPAALRPHLARHLRSLVQRELLQPARAELTADDAFRFRHILVRDAAYESLRKSDRAELHRRFVRWLVSAAGDRAEEFAEIAAYHLEIAHGYLSTLGIDEGRDEVAREAAYHFTVAGRRADSRGDAAAANKLLSRAIAIDRHDSADRIDALLALGRVQRVLGEFGAARQTLRDAEAAASRAGTEVAAARAELELVLVDVQVADGVSIERDKGALAEIGKRLGDAGDEFGLAVWRMAEGSIHELEGRNAAAAAAFTEALAHADSIGDRRAQAESLSRLILNLILGEAPVAEALTRCEQVLADWSEHPRMHASTLDSYALVLAMANRFDEARRAEEEALRIEADLNDRLNEGLHRSQGLGTILSLADDPIGAAREATRGCELLLELGARAWLSSAACVLGEIEFAAGNHEAAQHWLALAEESSVETDIDARTRARVLRARLAARNGDVLGAQPLIEQARAAVDPTELLHLRGVVAAGEGGVLWAAGKQSAARQRFAHAAKLHERKGDLARAARVRRMIERPTRWPEIPLV